MLVGAFVGYDYIVIAVFALFAIFIPVSFLLSSKMLRPGSRRNSVKNAPYESAEETIGQGRDIDYEYLPYFALFLPFEIIAIVMLLWSLGARGMPYSANLFILGLAASAAGFALVGYRFISDKNV